MEGIICKREDYVKYDGIWWRGKDHNRGRDYYFQQVGFDYKPNEYNQKFLHRYIYSKHVTRIKGIDTRLVHHIDGNSLNNYVDNLQLLTKKEHRKTFQTNHKGHPCSEETKEKLSKAMKGRKQTKEHISKARRTRYENKIKYLENRPE